MSAHPQPLGHLSIGVHNYAISKAFYGAVLEPLGLRLVYDSETAKPAGTAGPRTLGYGVDAEHELLNIFEHGELARPPGRGCHIAFNAASRQAVVDFHAAALRFGGVCDGRPGLRSHYGENYFAAFVICPDGWRLEAVCKKREDD
jgi:catechol 2,3-dioxygenase-like lactoylglutathione lyase family enzyme